MKCANPASSDRMLVLTPSLDSKSAASHSPWDGGQAVSSLAYHTATFLVSMSRGSKPQRAFIS